MRYKNKVIIYLYSILFQGRFRVETKAIIWLCKQKQQKSKQSSFKKRRPMRVYIMCVFVFVRAYYILDLNFSFILHTLKYRATNWMNRNYEWRGKLSSAVIWSRSSITKLREDKVLEGWGSFREGKKFLPFSSSSGDRRPSVLTYSICAVQSSSHLPHVATKYLNTASLRWVVTTKCTPDF